MSCQAAVSAAAYFVEEKIGTLKKDEKNVNFFRNALDSYGYRIV